MSDLTATGCGCRERDRGIFGGNNSCLIIIVLLFCCGGSSGFLGGGFGGCDDGCGRDSGCGSIIWIILILCLCGGF